MPHAELQHELPSWWRLALIAIATLILCSCRAPLTTYNGATPSGTGVSPVTSPALTGETSVPLAGGAVQPRNVARVAHYGAPSPALPSGAFQPNIPHVANCSCCRHSGTGVSPVTAPCITGGTPLPLDCTTYPTIPQDSSLAAGSALTPGDEWLCDGGDQERQVKVGGDFSVYGMDPEDTVAHFDTIDGRRLVKASNKVCVYSPRFAALRQVRGLSEHEQHDLLGNVHNPLHLVQSQESQLPVAYNQPVQPVGQVGTKRASAFRERTAGVYADGLESILAFQDRQSPTMPIQVLASNLLDQAEKARLSAAIDAAITWTHDHALVVNVGEQRLSIDTHDTKLGEIYMVKHEGTPKLQIVKLASTQAAQPGDEVEFALWFDNIGDEPLGNVTIIDNLTTRLEYIEGSQSCTIEANFFTEPNEAESQALRWEVIAPIPAGKGGICRFKCRVR